MSAGIPLGARVLATGPLDADAAGRLAARLQEGSLTILGGSRSALPGLRHRYARWGNIMVSPGDREDIPWADARFSLVVDSQPDQPTPEMLRVLAAGGSILSLEDLFHAP